MLRTVMCRSVWRRNVCDNLFYLVVLFSLFYCCASDNLKCQLSKSCWCAYPDGYGIDLSKVNQWHSAQQDNGTYYFRPCLSPASTPAEPAKCPSGASVCVKNSSKESYIDLGFENETEPQSAGLSKPIQLTFRHLGILTTVWLYCVQELNTTVLKVTPSRQLNQYVLSLEGPDLCLDKLVTKASDTPAADESTSLSTGSILVIMFFVFTSLYFAGGALALKLLRGAEGREMIPNYDFWVSLPDLVREGFLFSINCCKTPQAYDRI